MILEIVLGIIWPDVRISRGRRFWLSFLRNYIMVIINDCVGNRCLLNKKQYPSSTYFVLSDA